jgi:RNA polymerase sigma factor (sigma-70 family)
MEHRSHHDGSVTQLIGEMRDGDVDAVSTLWGRYFPQLANLARKTLGENPRRVADEEDAAISAFATFWKRANRGEFSDLAGRDSLWKLMAVITIRKAIKQTRRETAAKRGGPRGVVTETDIAASPGQPFLDTIRQVAGDVSFEEMDSLGYELMESLPDADLRSIALLKLMGYTNQEVAADLGCSIRRIERKLGLIRTIWNDSSA